MAITNLTVSNFKSFKQLDLNLGRFNVVIGANASGKSNFVEIFRFLNTLEQEDLADAISLHGGRESILNKKLGFSEPLRMRAASDQATIWDQWVESDAHESVYEFRLQFGSPQNGILITDDHLVQKCRMRIGDEDVEVRLDILLAEGKRKVEINPGDIVERLKGRRSRSTYAGFLPPADVYIQSLSWFVETTGIDVLLIYRALFGFTDPWSSLFGGVGVYDIDPHSVKRPHEKAGRASLERNGENLALVLKNILADPEKTRKFHNLLRYMLPFAVEVGVEDFLGMSLLLKLREEYYEESLLADLLSDGTVDVVALITALFFEDKDVVVIEEPERNIHPRLISGLVELMKDAARNKQVIVTTHSPELVKHAGLENLLLISRDKEGFSTISRPAEKETVKIFLEHDLGLDDLFVQDILAAP
jgi:predicted ATPase